MDIEEIKTRLRYARNFTPHKIGYYENLLKEAEDSRLTTWAQIEAENNAKSRAKKNFYTHQ